jgi:ATP-dependent Clp protease ATP-binding subunit ClpC
MFEGYTESARHVIFSARYMASEVGSLEIDTEHLLLGLLRVDKTLAQRFLGSPWAAEAAWKTIEKSKPFREQPRTVGEIPLTSLAKSVLFFAVEEAELFSSKSVHTEHLLLALLREEKSLAAMILSESGLNLVSAREELQRVSHDDASHVEFSRDHSKKFPQEVLELQAQIDSIKTRLIDAIANHDFETAQVCSNEEGEKRDKLHQLYRQHGFLDWLFD